LSIGCSLGGNKLGAKGAMIMANLLETNTTITSLEYAASQLKSNCQQPLN